MGLETSKNTKVPLLSSQGDAEEEGGVATIEKKEVKRPSLYRVILHNDDYTTMEFVILILQKFFSKTGVEAQEIMLKVHHEGAATCGVYTYEIAETKAEKVAQYARDNGHPLMCTLEPE